MGRWFGEPRAFAPPAGQWKHKLVAATAPAKHRADPGDDDHAKAGRAAARAAPSRATGIAAAASSVLQFGHQPCRSTDHNRQKSCSKAIRRTERAYFQMGNVLL